MAKQSKSMGKAVEWVQGLMDHLAEMDRMDRRTAKAAAKLLRAGCASTVNDGNQLWDDNVVASPDLDTGIALLELSNRCRWNADAGRYSLEDIYKEFPSK